MPQIQTRCAVRVESLVKVLPSDAGPVEVLRDVTVAFPRGHLTAVMGPSGSGKSTLLHCAAGLDRPTSGSAYLGDTDLGRLSSRALSRVHRERIGFVFQSFNLLPMLTAAQNVALPLRLAGRRLPDGQVEQILGRVGLAHLGHRLPGQLSGGQQQRVALARALAVEPEVIFADEPTGSLDTAAGAQVLDLLRGAVDRTGQSVVLVTHDPLVAARADSVLFLVDGTVRGHLENPRVGDIADRLAQWGF